MTSAWQTTLERVGALTVRLQCMHNRHAEDAAKCSAPMLTLYTRSANALFDIEFADLLMVALVAWIGCLHWLKARHC